MAKKSLSVKKNIRQSEKRRRINKAKKSRLKTMIKKFIAADEKTREKMYPEIQSLIDKAAKDNLIHKNKAARLKSKLSKLLQGNKVKAA